MGAWDQDFGSQPNLIQTQATSQAMPQPGQIEPGAAPQSAWDQDFGAFNKAQTAPQAAPSGPGTPEPDAPTWIGRRIQDIRGKQDPRFADLPTYSEPHESAAGAGALLSGADDHGIADVIKKELGGRFIKSYNDANGYPIIEYMGQDGQPKREYVNKPGLDAADAVRGVIGAVPYVMSGGLAGSLTRGLGIAGQALTQGTTAGATNILTQGGRQMAGSEQGFNPAETAITAAAGAGAQVLAPAAKALWSKFVTEPRLFNKAAGALTPEGEAAAKASGLDPSTLTKEIQQQFSEEWARTGNTQVGRTLSTKEFGLEGITRGVATKDPGQLLTEKAMRANVYGEGPRDTIKGADARLAASVEEAARGTGDFSVAAKINPGRTAKGTRPGDLGESIRSGVQEAEQAASKSASMEWDKVGKIVPSPEAMNEIPKFIGPKLGSLPIDPDVTPIAAKMARDIRAFREGNLPADFADITGRQPISDAIEMRKSLFRSMRSAKDAVDKSSARALYEGYGDWLEQSAASALKGGDPMQYAALRVATDKTRELKAIFGEAGPNGATPGRKIVQAILNGDEAATPEAIISKLFTVNPGATPKEGTVEALRLMKAGLEKYAAPETAQATFNDLKLAGWKRMIEDSSGNLLTPTMMSKNIEKALNSQGSVMRELYRPEDLRLIRNFQKAMEAISYKDPNPSGSGVAAAFYAGQFGQGVMRILAATNGAIPKVIQAITTVLPIKSTVGKIAANSAINPVVKSSYPVIGPYGAVAEQSRDQSSPLAGLVQ